MEKETKLYVPLVKIRIVKERELEYGKENICTPEKVVEIFNSLLEGADREHVLVICVDNRGKPTAVEISSVGTLNECLLEAREVFRLAINSCSYGIIILHNHVSGECNPSREDIRTTKKLLNAGELLGIRLLDHIIVGDGCFYSMRETGDLEE